MIEIRNVTFSYNTYEPINTVLNNVSFDVNNGEFVSLLGPSGCGKSTILKLIEKSILPQKGSIDVNFWDRPMKSLADYRRHIGYVCQSGNLLPHLTVIDNFKLQSKLRNVKCDINDNEFKQLLKISHFDKSLLNKFPTELSGGQLQRASILKGLIGFPKLLLLDEPFSALDPQTRDELQLEIGELHHSLPNVTILMITHDVQESVILSDRIIILKDGNIIFNDNSTNLMYTKDSELRNFLGIGDTKIPSIYYNSWRVAAIEKMKKYNCDTINILNDEGKIIGELSKDIIQKSLDDNKGNVLLSELIDEMED
jgi:osmoprotectant transport system ATP-binding protein